MVAIGQASRRSGVGVETIRFYERRGITPVPVRTSGGRRDYSDDDIRKLRFVRRCRDLGFSLTEASQMLVIAVGNGPSCEEVAGLAEQKLEVTAQKIEELVALRSALEKLVHGCRSGNENCPALVELLRD